MPIIYSPVDQEELVGPYQPHPRSAFLMLQSNIKTPPEAAFMLKEVSSALTKYGVTALTASTVRGTRDYLRKIVDLIRGCGAGIAIFSDRTPSRTVGNIFFEVGICLTLGKPVQLVWTGEDALPSDFTRTEYIRFDPADESDFRRNVDEAFATIFEEQAIYFKKLGDLALEAEEVGYELAFDRFKQAILLRDDPEARRAVVAMRRQLGQLASARTGDQMADHRRRLIAEIDGFLKFLPERRAS